LKFLLLALIRFYWAWRPAHRRRHCLYRESCSRFVYSKTEKEGLFSGLAALRYRYARCRPGYVVYFSPELNQHILILHNGEQVAEENISDWLLEGRGTT